VSLRESFCECLSSWNVYCVCIAAKEYVHTYQQEYVLTYYTHRQTDAVAKLYCSSTSTHTHSLTHSHTHTRVRTRTPAHTLELRCRRVWGLTLSRASCQQAFTSRKPAHDISIRRILGVSLSQVACVLERVRECVLARVREWESDSESFAAN